jgi:hypothetical protein
MQELSPVQFADLLAEKFIISGFDKYELVHQIKERFRRYPSTSFIRMQVGDEWVKVYRPNELIGMNVTQEVPMEKFD